MINRCHGNTSQNHEQFKRINHKQTSIKVFQWFRSIIHKHHLNSFYRFLFGFGSADPPTTVVPVTKGGPLKAIGAALLETGTAHHLSGFECFWNCAFLKGLGFSWVYFFSDLEVINFLLSRAFDTWTHKHNPKNKAKWLAHLHWCTRQSLRSYLQLRTTNSFPTSLTHLQPQFTQRIPIDSLIDKLQPSHEKSSRLLVSPGRKGFQAPIIAQWSGDGPYNSTRFSPSFFLTPPKQLPILALSVLGPRSYILLDADSAQWTKSVLCHNLQNALLTELMVFTRL